MADLSKYRAAFLAQPKYWPGQKGVFAPDHPMAQDVVRTLMGAEKLDAYIIVTPASFSVRGTNQGGGGLGIIRVAGRHLLHVAYIISVIDGEDFSYSGDMRAIPVDESTALGFVGAASRLSSPNVSVPQRYWENPANSKTDIKQSLGELAVRSLPHTLRRANLIE